MRVLYPGSFDPPHLGHLSVIARLAASHDEVVVAAVGNPAKTRFLTLDARRELLVALVAPWDNVEVVVHDGLLVDLAVRLEVTAIARAAGKEVDDELVMAATNRRLAAIPTIFVAPDAAVAGMGSRQVRELIRLGRPSSHARWCRPRCTTRWRRRRRLEQPDDCDHRRGRAAAVGARRGC